MEGLFLGTGVLLVVVVVLLGDVALQVVVVLPCRVVFVLPISILNSPCVF